MKYIEIVISEHSHEEVVKIAENVDAIDLRFFSTDKDKMQLSRMMIADDQLQKVLDSFSHIIGAQGEAKIMVLEIDAYLPKSLEENKKEKSKVTEAREIIYADMVKNTYINSNYLALVILSTIVASIGLIENNVAVIIGAMVIAPLLGPNIALSFAAVTGDTELMLSSVKTVLAGLSIAIVLPIFIGYFSDLPFDTPELLSRTDLKLDMFLLALASGAAAALSVTTGLSSAMVGVMVAVALLPPAATLGIMLGAGHWSLAHSTAIMLLMNIVSINLASKVVFIIQGIKPALWPEQEQARKFMIFYGIVWITLLVTLFIYVYLNLDLFGSASL
ncbi:MAG: TIGR00341 family protein [Sulfurovum sp.]|nr:TIGR00341 family protein [Sulfurovum sp.]